MHDAIDLSGILSDAPAGILPPLAEWPTQVVEIERRV